MTTKAFVLLSGGIDSSTCLALAVGQAASPNDVTAISMHYGQRHVKEIDSARALGSHYGIRHHVARLDEQPPSMLTDVTAQIPDVSYEDLPAGQSPTYVPFRNGQMLSRIAAIASASISKDDDAVIYFGAHAEDAARWAYPDCTPEFIGAMANAIYIGTYLKVRLIAPFMSNTKAQIITAGTSFGVPYELTWSCYKGETLHCGVCPTCRSRRDAFTQAGVADPTIYAQTAA